MPVPHQNRPIQGADRRNGLRRPSLAYVFTRMGLPPHAAAPREAMTELPSALQGETPTFLQRARCRLSRTPRRRQTAATATQTPTAIAPNAIAKGRSLAAILASHDFSQYRHIVDVGGGNGVLLSRILAAVPEAEGCIFDTPAGVKGARRRLEQAGVVDRCRITTGDFFEAVPEAADAYILKSVLHDWDDDQATIILENCRRAMHPDGVLLIVERLLPERINCCDAHREITMMDMHMLVVPGGRERTIAEYAALCAAAWLEPIGVRPSGSPFAIIQARKIDAPATSHTAQAEEQRP